MVEVEVKIGHLTFKPQKMEPKLKKTWKMLDIRSESLELDRFNTYSTYHLTRKNDENWTWQVIVFDLWISALGVGHWSSASMAGHTTHDNYLKMLDILQRANTRGTIAVYR
jgi:hypothetical protein